MDFAFKEEKVARAVVTIWSYMVQLEGQISTIWSQQLAISCALVLCSALLQGHRFVYEVSRPVQLLGAFWDSFGILRGSLRSFLSVWVPFGDPWGLRGAWTNRGKYSHLSESERCEYFHSVSQAP